MTDSVMTLLQTIVTGVLAYFMAKLNWAQKIRAIEATQHASTVQKMLTENTNDTKETKNRVNEIAVNSEKQLDNIAKTTQDELDVQLKCNVDLTQRIFDVANQLAEATGQEAEKKIVQDALTVRDKALKLCTQHQCMSS